MSGFQAHRDRDVVGRIEAYNAGRDPQLLVGKYAALRESPFRFFRGTAHLFWEDWARTPPDIDEGPAAWCCGDLHLENYGSYRGDNRLIYFDINDFDEAALAPATRDIARLLTSLWLAAELLELADDDVTELANHLLDTYAVCLLDGKARWIERATAGGVVKHLLVQAKRYTRETLLAAKTERHGKSRRLIVDQVHTLPVRSADRLMVTAALSSVGIAAQRPSFFEVIDVARRVAGTGSLGLARYVALVNGHGTEDGNFLLDVKQSAPSSLARYAPVLQPHWTSEASRVTRVQCRMQAAAPALLQPLRMGAHQFVLRELQPSENRLNLAHLAGKPARIRKATVAMARLLAWGQLRSSGRQGAATADDLFAFAHAKPWRASLSRYARSYSRTVMNDWRAFRAASQPLSDA